MRIAILRLIQISTRCQVIVIVALLSGETTPTPKAKTWALRQRCQHPWQRVCFCCTCSGLFGHQKSLRKMSCVCVSQLSVESCLRHRHFNSHYVGKKLYPRSSPSLVQNSAPGFQSATRSKISEVGIPKYNQYKHFSGQHNKQVLRRPITVLQKKIGRSPSRALWCHFQG